MSEHPRVEDLARLCDLAPAERQRLLVHLGGCPECRARAAAAEPAALFALLALHPLPAGALDRLDRGLERRLDDDGARPRPVRRIWAAAGLAASLLLAGLLGGQLERVAEPDLRAVATGQVTLGELPERGLELLSAPGEAEVVDLALGETHVVMIFTEGLGL